MTAVWSARYRGRGARAGIAIAAVFMLLGAVSMAQDQDTYDFLLDDFSDPSGVSSLGTKWEGFTDRVMGGVSDMSAGVESTPEGRALHMTGEVSLENNGGFIQMRLELAESGSFDAGDYTGIALVVRGAGENYYLHLRTPRTVFPWSHFAAPFPVTGKWQRVEVPFSRFEPRYMLGGRLEPSRLRSVAVVAGFAAFEADLWVRSIGLYR